MSLQLESQPSLAHQAALARRKFRSDIAANAVADLGIDLRGHRTPPQPAPEIIAPEQLSEPMIQAIKRHRRDWLWVTRPVDRIQAFPPDILHTIIMAVCHKFEITLLDIRCKRRARILIIPRHVAMTLCNELTLKSLPEICRQFNNRDHSCLINARKKIAKLVRIDSWACQMMAEVRGEIESHLQDWRGIEAAKISLSY